MYLKKVTGSNPVIFIMVIDKKEVNRIRWTENKLTLFEEAKQKKLMV